MNGHLKSAQNKLRIQAVNLKESKIWVRDNIDLPSVDRDDTIAQVFRGVTQIQETSLSSDDEKEVWDYRFIYTSGIRLIFSSEEEESKKEDYAPIVEVVGVFSAKYFSSDKLDKDEFKAFCEDSVGYHIWPYWREYVQSTCARIDFYPAFEVPVYFMPQNND